MFGISKKRHIVTDEKRIDEILSRSVAKILPSKEALKKALMKGDSLRFYVGVDATGSELHLGHATNFMFLEKVRQLGHEVIILFGDFTAMIGDPTDKEAARVALSKEEVAQNITTWKEQVGKIIGLRDTTNPVTIKKNSLWLSKLSLEEVIDLSAAFTVQQLLERDMFEKRIKAGKPVYVHEFFYPLLQGYDSVELNVDVEVGGTDQTFNMLAGRTLQKKYHNKEKFIVATTLLENPKTGKKLMSKSEGGYVALSDAADEMFGKVMALPDEVIIQMFTDTTHMPTGEIETMKNKLKKGENPRDIKMKLAKNIVTLYHGSERAEEAENNFVKTFSKKETPSEIEEISVLRGTKLADVLSNSNHVRSKTEFRRLIKNGAIRNDSGEKIHDTEFVVENNIVFKIGKKRFIKIITK